MKGNHFFELDFNAKYIINVLVNSSDSGFVKSEIKFRISQLNIVQFLKVFDAVLPRAYNPETFETFSGMELTIENLELFFSFIKGYPDTCFQNVISYLYLVDIMDINSQISDSNLSRNDIEVLKKNVIEQVDELKNEIIDKLSHLMEVAVNKKSLHFKSALIFDDDYSELSYHYVGSIFSLDYEVSDMIRNSNALEFMLQRLKQGIYIKNLSINELKSSSYLLNIDNKLFGNLYTNLEKYGFIDIDKTTKEDFFNVFFLGWDEHESIIYLEMDHLQFRLFLDLLKETFEVKISLPNLELAGNIHNKNGRIKASSVYASSSKSKMPPKHAELIRSIVEDAKQIDLVN